MLCHLVYVSTATRPMRDEDLVELLAEARKHNEENDITGMLLHKDGRFLQLLEGHEENVQAAFDVIKQDERHYRVDHGLPQCRRTGPDHIKGIYAVSRRGLSV
jgi:hypothetical protein